MVLRRWNMALLFPGSAVLCLGLTVGNGPLRADIFSLGDTELLAFADSAAGDATPLRVITSSSASLTQKNAVALDQVHRELYVGRSGEVLVFDSRETGDTAPLRTIGGNQSGLGIVSAVAVDLANDLLYVASWDDDSIRVFHRTDDGNLPPLRTLAGPVSTMLAPEGVLVDLVHGELVVSSSANDGSDRSVNTYALSALQGSGTIDVAPVRRIAGAATLLVDPRGLALDLDADRLLVVDRDGAISFFARTANGNVAPLNRIAGGNTQLGAGQEIQILDDGELLVGTDGAPSSKLVFHDGQASGNANPSREIFGAATELTFSLGVASSRAKDCAWAKSVDGCLYRDNFEGGSLCDWSATTDATPCP